jgi:hypothetical protein
MNDPAMAPLPDMAPRRPTWMAFIVSAILLGVALFFAGREVAALRGAHSAQATVTACFPAHKGSCSIVAQFHDLQGGLHHFHATLDRPQSSDYCDIGARIPILYGAQPDSDAVIATFGRCYGLPFFLTLVACAIAAGAILAWRCEAAFLAAFPVNDRR